MPKNLLKVVLFNSALLGLLLLVLDTLAYFALPTEYSAALEEYRRAPPPRVTGGGQFLHDYWVAHPERGFDIGKNRRAVHWVGGVTFDVWSNSMGCFDVEHAAITDYVYFAGDSFTWGFSPFESKFGTIVERVSGTTVLKCGVAHTGQIHQYEKLLDITEAIGKPPRALFVFFYYNDIANDYAHPHSTVIDGWQVDTVSLGPGDELIRPTRDELERRLHSRIAEVDAELNNELSLADHIKLLLRRYSLSANVANFLWDNFRDSLSAISSDDDTVDGSGEARPRSFYFLPQEHDDRVWYTNNDYASANKQAIREIKRFCDTNGTRLIFALIPPATAATDLSWHSEVRQFLDEQSIEYVDLASRFNQKQLSSRELYWREDVHLNPSGNAAVAKILLDDFADIFTSTDTHSEKD